ncbi:MAG: glycosyltransferase family 8 protein [Lachnospiraceae bacterium]
MNIMYCGNDKVEDGLILSILSLLRSVDDTLHIYVLTMQLETSDRSYLPIANSTTEYLESLVKERNPNNFVRRIDVTNLFLAELPEANMNTRFTPYCMLRLFADKVPDLPNKILYLDTDVICRRDCCELFAQDISAYEIAGVLDYYGRWFFHRKLWHFDYVNSGVLLMNLNVIKQTRLLEKCRKLCTEKNMFMPDQSALNKLITALKIFPRHFNEQHKLREDTVLQHFTTTFRFFPWLHTLTVKPWQIENVRCKLKIYEYDELFAEYMRILPTLKSERMKEI